MSHCFTKYIYVALLGALSLTLTCPAVVQAADYDSRPQAQWHARWLARAEQQQREREWSDLAAERAQRQASAWMAIPNCRNLPGCMAAYGADQILSPGDTDFNPYYACARYYKWCQ